MIKKFLDYSAYTLCLAELTIVKYRQVLEKFDSFLLERGKTLDEPEQIEILDVYNFIGSMREGGVSINYCNSFTTAYRSFLNYLREVLNLNVLDPHRIKFSKAPERDIGYYNQEEKAQILDLVREWVGYKSITQLRNKLLVYLFLHTGLRCHELAKIRVQDIWEGNEGR